MNCSNKLKKYDVIIVGAGFAGLMLAHYLSRQQGLTILILEAKKKFSDKVHTTGIIVQECYEILCKEFPHLQNSPEILQGVNTVQLFSPNLSQLSLKNENYFFYVSHVGKLFSAIMKCLLQNKNLTVNMGKKVLHINEQEGIVYTESKEFKGEKVILTSGMKSLSLLKQLDMLPPNRFLMGKELIFNCEKAQSIQLNGFYCFLGNDFAPGYLGWVIKGPRGIQVGLASKEKKLNFDIFFNHILKISELTFLKYLVPTSKHGGLIPISKPLNKLQKGRIFLGGDLTSAVSPLSAGGIRPAIMGAKKLAAEIIQQNENSFRNLKNKNKYTVPQFSLKHFLRILFEIFGTDTILNIIFKIPLFGFFANIIFFKRAKVE